MFRIVLDEHKKREIDPTLEVLRECLAEAEKERGTQAAIVRKRIKDMLSFFETMSSWYRQIRGLPPAAVKSFVRMGQRVRRLFGKGA